MPKPLKIALIEPKLFRHLHNTFNNIFAQFHANPIYQASISPNSLFRAINSEPSAQISFSLPKFKPSTHFTHIYPYKPIREVSAQFHVISYLNSNSKPHMALFLVQTPFSCRLTSRSPYLSMFQTIQDRQDTLQQQLLQDRAENRAFMSLMLQHTGVPIPQFSQHCLHRFRLLLCQLFSQDPLFLQLVLPPLRSDRSPWFSHRRSSALSSLSR
jgi:hypothetical protein